VTAIEIAIEMVIKVGIEAGIAIRTATKIVIGIRTATKIVIAIRTVTKIVIEIATVTATKTATGIATRIVTATSTVIEIVTVRVATGIGTAIDIAATNPRRFTYPRRMETMLIVGARTTRATKRVCILAPMTVDADRVMIPGDLIFSGVTLQATTRPTEAETSLSRRTVTVSSPVMTRATATGRDTFQVERFTDKS
jgi:hypothetical protein